MGFSVFNTIKVKLLLIFLFFSFMTIILSFVYYTFYLRRESSGQINFQANQLAIKILSLNNLQLKFLLYDAKNNGFYISEKSQHIRRYDSLFKEVRRDILNLKENHKTAKTKEKWNNLEKVLDIHKKQSNEVVRLIHTRGFRNNGLEGLMRKYIHQIEEYKEDLNYALLLTIRRNEKDYILRKDEKYIWALKHSAGQFAKSIENQCSLPIETKRRILSLLFRYLACFEEWIIIDKEIGIDQGIGLSKEIKESNEALNLLLSEVLLDCKVYDTELWQYYKLFFIIIAIISIIVSIILSFIFATIVTKPICLLSEGIKEVVGNNFESMIRVKRTNNKNEIGELEKNINWMICKAENYIDKIKVGEEILRKNERKFKALIENSNDAIALTNEKGKIIYSSPSTERLTGYKPEELLGKKTVGFVHPEDKQELLLKFAEVLNSPGQIFIIQFRMINKEGNFRWIESYSSNHLNDPSINGIITNYRDVTEKKFTEIKVQQQNIELQKINSELDRFVYSASHDLKAPLTSILGIVNVAQMEPDKTLNDHYLNLIKESVNKLIKVIKDLTDFSRNARVQVMEENIDFDSIIKDILKSITYLHNFDGLKIKVENNLTAAFFSDSLRIKTLLNNLISNAVLYHDCTKPIRYLTISFSPYKNGVNISVEDNGKGIEESNQSKVFDMFYRASEDSTGSGLGLYIVKGIIQKLGGNITLSSKLGKGTNFMVFLPDIKIKRSTTNCMNYEQIVQV